MPEQTSVALAALGIVASITTALVWLLKKLYDQNATTLKQLSRSSNNLANSIEQLSRVSERQSKIIERQEKAADEWQKYVVARFDKLDSTGEQILKQTVREQTVLHQTIKSDK